MAIQTAAVIGGGSFGTVIGNILADNGIDTTLWLRNEDAAREINDTHHNEQYLPGVKLNPELKASVSLQQAVTGAGSVHCGSVRCLLPAKQLPRIC